MSVRWVHEEKAPVSKIYISQVFASCIAKPGVLPLCNRGQKRANFCSRQRPPKIVYETVPCLHLLCRTLFSLSLFSLASSASDCVSFPSTLVAPDHVCELLIGGIEAVVAHHAPQLPHRDLAVVVGVEQRERLLEAVQLLRSQFEFSCCIRSVCTY